MKTNVKKNLIAVVMAILFSGPSLLAQCNNICSMDAGPNKVSSCVGGNVQIGVSGCAGEDPNCTYVITWTPSNLVVSGQGTCQPTVNPTTTTKFYLRVRFNGNCCCSATGSCALSTCDTLVKIDSMTVTVNGGAECRLSTSMMEKDMQNPGISIYPNPTIDKITISISKELYANLQAQSKAVIIVYDINGKMLFSEEANDHNTGISLSSLPKGSYFIRVMKEENTLSIKKIIRN